MRIGIVGLGSMGSGIAQLAIESGFETVGREIDLPRAEEARDKIAHFLTRKVEKGRLDQTARDAAVARLVLTTDLADLAPATSSSRRHSRISLSSTSSSAPSKESFARTRSWPRTPLRSR